MRVEALPETLVVDAERRSEMGGRRAGLGRAVALVAGRALVTSALFWVEAANVLATKERRGELDRVGTGRCVARPGPERRWRRCRSGQGRRNALARSGVRAPAPRRRLLLPGGGRGARRAGGEADRRFRGLAERYPSIAGRSYT